MEMPRLESNSGVYAIICLVTGKRYIGSSKNLRKRLHSHRGKLRRNRHTSPHLRNAYNKYGEGQFSISIVEYCPPENLLDKEQYHLDDIKPYDPANGFNTSKTAQNAGGTFKSSAAAIAKIKAYAARSRDENIAKKIASHGRSFRIKSPEGKIYEAKGIAAFARQHGLRADHVHKVIHGKTTSAKGWTLPETNLPEAVFIDPTGQTHHVPWCKLKPFCRLHDLRFNSMSQVRDEEQIEHQGWGLPKNWDKMVTFVSPKGEEVSVKLNHLSLFAVKRDLQPCNVSALVRGTNAQYLGWTIKK